MLLWSILPSAGFFQLGFLLCSVVIIMAFAFATGHEISRQISVLPLVVIRSGS